MKTYLLLGTLLLAASLRAQTAAFTYQGRLNDNGVPANGIYDLKIGLWTAATGPLGVGEPLTNTAVAVSNGLFTVTLDFGVFDSQDRWLEIAVRTNGASEFTTLSPRQPITPAPVATHSVTADSANTVIAGNIAGTLNIGQLPTTLITNGASGVNVSGTFAGNGTGLTSLNATNLTGTLSDAALSTNVALRIGGNVLTDSQQVTGAVATGTQALDQQDTTTLFGANQLPNQWQSFTAGTSGLLTAVALQLRSPLFGSNSSPGTISIYTGEGTNGTLLATQSVTWVELVGTFQTNAFSYPPQLQAGNKYTIFFTAPVVQKGWIYLDSENHYAGGRCSDYASQDCLFKTFMTPGTAGQTILMVNPQGFSGNVGIGTNAPQAKLHVVGNILATGTITGNGGGLTNLNAISGTGTFGGTLSGTFTGNATGTFTGNANALTNLDASDLASGTVPDARLSSNVALLNRTNQAFTGATNSFSGNVGIGTTTPQSKLQVAGDVKLGPSGQYFAPAGEENLRMIRGSVAGNGTILNGSGFTCTRTANATYSVTFNTAFSSNPSIIISCGAAGGTLNSQDSATIPTASTTGFTVLIGVRNIGFSDEPFSFIAIGPR